MGWWVHYIGFTPKGKERIKYVIEEEGYDAEDERHIWKPIATALYKPQIMWQKVTFLPHFL